MKTQALKKITFSLFAIAMNAACSLDTVDSDQVNPDAIYQSYDLTFSEDSNSTEFTGTFRVGGFSGTTVKLTPPSRLVVNGKGTQPTTFLGTNYHLNLGHGFTNTINIKWYDQSETLYENTITIKEIKVTSAPNQAVIGQPYSVSIETSALAKNENVRAYISQKINEVDYVYVSGDYNPTQKTLSFKNTSKLTNGPATLQISRDFSRVVQSGTSEGGMLTGRYVLSDISITVIKP